jgi:head-tail adaptor
MLTNEFTPGPIVLMGSGETSTSSGAVFEKVAGNFPPPVKISILETPAGFELNSARVAGRVADYLKVRLQNYKPEISIIPARKKDTEFSPDTQTILEPLYHSDVIFMGPGSPTYTARQLTGTLAYEIIQAKHRTGSALVLASAATIAFGCQTMPVYEIFKAGMDLHWQAGLDFFRDYGLSLIIIPHWNNSEGGADLDTSRCFMGKDRFEQLLKILSCDGTVVGIDEHTSLWVNLAKGEAQVFGKDTVHIIQSGKEHIYKSGESIPLHQLGRYSPPRDINADIRLEVQQRLENISAAEQKEKNEPLPASIIEIMKNRDAARARKDFANSDILRKQAEEAGWRILDTQAGQQIEKM